MASLEELMPELAGVLAAQESALETVVATLATQMRALLADSERQARRVQQLERDQSESKAAMAELQDEARAAIAEGQRRVDQALGGVQAAAHAALEHAVAAAEAQTMARLEKYVDGRLDQAGGALQPAGATQEAVQDQLELLDKKYEYLSRVKMEIKDLTRRVEKQDQTIDGMKIGLEMLSKSIGADEGNSGSDDDGEGGGNDSDSDMSDVQLPVNDIFSPRSASSLPDLALSFEHLHQPPSEGAEPTPSPRLLDENVRNMAAPHAQIKRLAQRRSLTLDIRHALEIMESKRNALTARGSSNNARRASSPQGRQRVTEATALREESPQLSTRSEVQEPIAAVSDRPEEPQTISSRCQESTSDEPSLVEVVPSDTMPTEDVVGTENADPPAEEPAAAQPTEVSDVNDSDTHKTEEVADEQANEDIPVPESPALEHQQVFPIAEEPEIPVPIFTARSSRDEGDNKPSTPATSPVIHEEHEHSSEADDDIPVVYKQRTLSYQKQLEDSVALFHPASSSSSASSTSRAGHPTSGRLAMVPSASAVFRSRRQERSMRRQTTLVRKGSEVQTDRREMTTARIPMSVRGKKEIWHRIFAKLVQLRRLHMLNGANPEKSLFRKQNTSVGARVRRLEETSGDMEKAIEMLEASIQMNSHGVQTLDELLSQYRLTTSSSVQTLALEQKSQTKTLLEMDEKMEQLDQEVRRMRTSNRRNSVQSSASSTTAMAAISVQVQQISARLEEHTMALQAADTLIKQLAETDIPAVQERADESLRSFRVEVERRLKDWVSDSRRSMEALNAEIADTNRLLSTEVDGCFARIYGDVLTTTTAILRGAELAQDITTPSSSQAGQPPRRSFDTGIEMLETILSKLAGVCNSLAGESESEDAVVIAEQAITFVHELQQLQAQATKATPLVLASSPATPDGASSNSPHANAPSATSSSSKGFEEHLIQVTSKYVKMLESVLVQHQDGSSPDGNPDNVHPQRDGESDPASEELMSFVRDAVVQVRAVLFLLRFCRQTSDERQEFQEMQSLQATMGQDIKSHSFAISQVGSTLAMVKLMNSRLDAFLELSFSFAKDDDVKKSIQDMMSSSVAMRDKLAKQVEDAQREAVQRDAMLERDLNQLISRVNKKLDKDELLWTQEVLERQLQSVAKASLGEEDLVDIHRLLRHKLDKTQFSALLQDQRAKMTTGGNTEVIDWLSGGNGGSTAGSGPLIGAKCISCQGELPPSKAMIKTVVKQEVQHEMAKAKAQQQVGALASPSAPAGFNASSHRNMEKFKTEILLSSLQKQAKK